MLMADPIYNYDGEAKGYGVCTLEPAWDKGQNPEIGAVGTYTVRVQAEQKTRSIDAEI